MDPIKLLNPLNRSIQGLQEENTVRKSGIDFLARPKCLRQLRKAEANSLTCGLGDGRQLLEQDLFLTSTTRLKPDEHIVENCRGRECSVRDELLLFRNGYGFQQFSQIVREPGSDLNATQRCATLPLFIVALGLPNPTTSQHSLTHLSSWPAK